MMSRRSFLNCTGAIAVAAAAIDGVERAAAAEPSARLAAPAADRSYAVPPSIHPDLKGHGTIFERKIHQVGDHVYSAVGFANGDSVMVVGNDGVIILLSSEVVPAQHFPTLQTLRGEAFRNPVDWYRSIDVLRRFQATAIVPSHGVPVVGAAAVEEVWATTGTRSSMCMTRLYAT